MNHLNQTEDQKDNPFDLLVLPENMSNNKFCLKEQEEKVYFEDGYTIKQLRKILKNSEYKGISGILGISLSHACLLWYIDAKEPDNLQVTLNNTEKILGPNWRGVLEFWSRLDTLSEKQFSLIAERSGIDGIEAMDRVKKDIANALEGTIGYDYAYSAPGVVLFSADWDPLHSWLSVAATRELIGYHRLLGLGDPLRVFPYFRDIFENDSTDKNSLSQRT